MIETNTAFAFACKVLLVLPILGVQNPLCLRRSKKEIVHVYSSNKISESQMRETTFVFDKFDKHIVDFSSKRAWTTKIRIFTAVRWLHQRLGH